MSNEAKPALMPKRERSNGVPKADIPKPKFDVGNLVAFKYETVVDRSDDVPVKTEVKGAGEVEIVQIRKFRSGWDVSYMIDGHTVAEHNLKRINI